MKVIAPDQGIYHGAFPDFGDVEDRVSDQAINDFEQAVDKPLAWAYFSNNWFVQRGDTLVPEIKFPSNAVEIIRNHRHYDPQRQHNIVPFIRMMPRSRWKSGAQDPLYKLQSIIDGRFDSQLKIWARDAKATGIPLMVEFGTEGNDKWAPWSGERNGGGDKKYGDKNLADGPERFRDAYRHIINLFRGEGVDNITWVFHMNAGADPDKSWNKMAAYYPDDTYIDWLGLSVYGPQKPGDAYQTFETVFQPAFDELSAVSGKPIAILEFGIIEDPRKAEWIEQALNVIKRNRARVKAISYWHSIWKNNGDVSDMLLKGESLRRYKAAIADPIFKSDVQFTQP